jgi:D-serine deaminase-like pyridoxal phosphate-dependent protein
VSQESRAFNEALVGRRGSRLLLDTPALVLDLDAFAHNLETMQALARSRAVALRPHAKIVQLVPAGERRFEPSLFVYSRVVSWMGRCRGS